jgi:chromosomal replication initiator protein
MRKVIFTSSGSFANELMVRSMPTAWAKFRGADARLLDDVESLAGSERTQEELFHTFDSLHAATTGFIHQSARSESQLTSDKFGVTSPGSSAANRFECALTADIAAPTSKLGSPS